LREATERIGSNVILARSDALKGLPSFLPILKHVLKLKKAEAAIIDAALVESAARPRTHIEAPKTGSKTIRRCISAPIRIHGWMKKGGEKYAGLHGITRTDKKGFADVFSCKTGASSRLSSDPLHALHPYQLASKRSSSSGHISRRATFRYLLKLR
jgi:hypothetical protein